MRAALKRAAWIAGAAMAAALVIYAFLPAAVEVDVAAVSQGLIELTVSEEGRTRVRDRYVISAPLAGTLQRAELRAGDSVAAELTVLAKIRPAPPQLLDARQLAEAKARVEMAQAEVERAAALRRRSEVEAEWAQSERDRVQALHQRGAASQTELNDAILLHRVRVVEQDAAAWAEQVGRHDLEMARAALLGLGQAETTDAHGSGWGGGEDMIVRSPVPGQVLRVIQESEAFVQAGAPLLEIGQVQDLEVVMDVLSRDAVRIREGQEVRFVRWGGDMALSGRVRRVEPSAFTRISALGVEEQRVNVIADLLRNEETALLGDGFRVDGEIIVARRTDALTVPTGSLFRHGERWAVFAVVDHRSTLRHVRIGLRGSLEAEVLEGLEPGDTVILYPSDRIRDGVRVEPRNIDD